MNKTLLFYDIETSGLNKAFDQVLQFAAIRTDLKLQEIERTEIIIKLNPDVIPSPQAMITHRLTLADIAHGMCELEAVEKIHALLNTPGTTSLGYNTLNFDDEFLRFSFYRNLLTPYTHQWANDCGRMDIYPITVMYFLYHKDVIDWPSLDGQPSLKLEQLSAANHLTRGSAHNAMSDVEATLELTRHFTQAQNMWRYVSGYFDKKTDYQRALRLPPAFRSQHAVHHEALIIDGSYGLKLNFQFPVLSLGNHNHYKNQNLWLRLDLPELRKTTTDSIPETTWVVQKKFAETGLLLPPLERYLQFLDSERREQIEKNKKWLQKNEKIFQKIINYHKEYTYPKILNLDIDAALYQNGFLSDKEQQACNEFHTLSAQNKINFIDNFSNVDLQQQAIRIVGRNYPELLKDSYKEEFALFLKKIKDGSDVIDYRNKKHLTPKEALTEINTLKSTPTLEQQQPLLLDKLQQYIHTNFIKN